MHNESVVLLLRDSAAGKITYSHQKAPAIAGKITYSHKKAPAIAGKITYNHQKAPAIAGKITYSHEKAPAIAGKITYSHQKAPAIAVTYCDVRQSRIITCLKTDLHGTILLTIITSDLLT